MIWDTVQGGTALVLLNIKVFKKAFSDLVGVQILIILVCLFLFQISWLFVLKYYILENSASADGGLLSPVRACESLRSAPDRH